VSGEKPVILVGRKPTMNYVTAALLALKEGRGLVLRARGRAISRAVDVSQILLNRFAKDHEVKQVEIGTDELKREDGSVRPVSTISIVLDRKTAPAGRPRRSRS